MSRLQLDPESQCARIRALGDPGPEPTAARAVVRGALGFTWVSVAGFVPWAIGGRWLHAHVGLVGMYLACALVFLGLSGLALHRLILGPGSLSRFYALFTPAFAVYAVAWIACSIAIPGDVGGALGLLAGTALMGWMFSRAFGCRGSLPQLIGVLFVLNAVGYFGGGVVEAALAGWKTLGPAGAPFSKGVRMTLAMLSWGVCYGLGFGAGLGLAFHLCQRRLRERVWGAGASSAAS